MKAIIKCSIENAGKEIVIENFKSVYNYDKYVEVKGADEFKIEQTAKIPLDNLVSINIVK